MNLDVLVIDDHTLFREGLIGLLTSRNINVVASVGDGEEGIKLVEKLKPDIVLLDMRMPNLSGLEVLSRLKKLNITVPISILTTSIEERDLIEALRNGARGYLLKDMEPDDLLVALKDIVAGKTVVAPPLTHVLAKVVQGDDLTAIDQNENPFGDLTPREGEILSLLAEGQSNKVIARNLGISDGTVKLHVKAILRKLQVHSRVEAAVMAVEYNLKHESKANET